MTLLLDEFSIPHRNWTPPARSFIDLWNEIRSGRARLNVEVCGGDARLYRCTFRIELLILNRLPGYNQTIGFDKLWTEPPDLVVREYLLQEKIPGELPQHEPESDLQENLDMVRYPGLWNAICTYKYTVEATPSIVQPGLKPGPILCGPDGKQILAADLDHAA